RNRHPAFDSCPAAQRNTGIANHPQCAQRPAGGTRSASPVSNHQYQKLIASDCFHRLMYQGDLELCTTHLFLHS
ncbi:hypothetical protein, partial [Azospirillum brasilense]|uniref:hypothetical protein n=1 Tax=Azospirillum brasilense TaxID=192 RepID=UPI001B3BD663